MIIGVGIDIAESCRIEATLARFGEKFFEHIYSDKEIALLADARRDAAFHAGRWAAKEAAAKALGVGFGANCHPAEIVITNGANGAPQIEFIGETAKLAAATGAKAWVSISHEKNYATAVVILEK